MSPAMRIKSRAVTRLGDLLEDLEKVSNQHEAKARAGCDAPTSTPRQQATVAAGISKDQSVQAIRVANVPEPLFREMVERPKPATITEIAKRGTVPASVALDKCVRIDECKEWADKAAALESYARQRDDDSLLRAATQIKGRAVRRIGELLKERKDPDKPKGGRPKNGGATPTVLQSARAAGISKDQAHQAQAVARFARQEPQRPGGRA